MRDRSAKLFLRARNLFIYRKFEKETVENELEGHAAPWLRPRRDDPESSASPLRLLWG